MKNNIQIHDLCKAVFLTLCFFVLFGSTSGQGIQQVYQNFYRHSQNKLWKQASKSLDSLLILDPTNNYWLYYKAETEAQLGNLPASNQYLSQAISNGFVYLEQILTNKKLEPLHNTGAYNTSINNLKVILSQYLGNDIDQKLIVNVPPILECYVIMLYLGNPAHPLINSRQNHSYFARIENHFAGYKNHPLVLKLAEMYPGKEWINNLRAHHNLRTLYVYDSLNIDEIKRLPIELDNSLAKIVAQFARETDFILFYSANMEFYNAMSRILKTNYAFGSHVITYFNRNFDMRINRFNVYYSPIYGGWQHGPTARVDNHIECFYFGGIMYTNAKEFYYPEASFLFTLLTEFDHTPINDLTNGFGTELEKLNHKLPLLNSSGNVSYGNIKSTIEEYITWAFALQFFYEYTPSEYLGLEENIIRTMEHGRKFIRFGEFMEFYKVYINNRDQYPKMIDFYPEILKWVEAL